MPRLLDVWREAWTGLGDPDDEVHEILSSRQKGKQDGFMPSPRAVRAIFPAAFDRDLGEALKLPTNLRGARYVKAFTEIGLVEAERILHAVDVQALLLRRTATFVKLVDPLTNAEALGVKDKREALIRLCYEWARLHNTMTTELAEVLLSELDRVPSITGMTSLLRDPDAITRLQSHLNRAAAATLVASQVDQGGAREEWSPDSWGPLLAFLDDEDLAGRFATEAANTVGGPPAGETLRHWEAALAVNTAGLHHHTAALGLSHTSPPPAPLLCSPCNSNKPDTEEIAVLHLDTSVEDRLRMALNTTRENRKGLPSELTLLQEECERAVQPLGLNDPVSRTVVGLGSVLIQVVDSPKSPYEQEEDYEKRVPHLARQVNAVIGKWQAARKAAYATAGMPGVVAGYVGDLTAPYMRLLWKRVHNHEVRRRNDYSPEGTWNLLSGVARTLTERLDHTAAAKHRERPLEDHTRVPRHGTVGTDEYADWNALLLWIEVSHIRETAGVDQETFAALFEGLDVDSEDHQDTWALWCEAADSRLPLRAVADWLERYAPM